VPEDFIDGGLGALGVTDALGVELRLGVGVGDGVEIDPVDGTDGVEPNVAVGCPVR
jgi:hypothetical protein